MTKKLKKSKKKLFAIKTKPASVKEVDKSAQNLIAVYVSPENKQLDNFLKELKSLNAGQILVVDDSGLAKHKKIYQQLKLDEVIFHKSPLGFEKSLAEIADFAKKSHLHYLVALEAESLIWLEYVNHFIEEAHFYEAVSGSRYLDPQLQSDLPDLSESTINKIVSHLISIYTGYHITDAFAHFKAFKIKALEKINFKNIKTLAVHFWFGLARTRIKFSEIPIPLSESVKPKLKEKLLGPKQKLESYLNLIEEQIKKK